MRLLGCHNMRLRITHIDYTALELDIVISRRSQASKEALRPPRSHPQLSNLVEALWSRVQK